MNIFILSAAAAISIAPEASPRYQDCLTLVEANIEIGRIAAQQWAAEGGGADAQHCLALADIAAGFPKLGAARLEGIAQRKDAGDDFIRARLLAQAAEAWLAAGQMEFAEKTIADALELAPEAHELYLTDAKVHASALRWQETITSVSAAEKAGFVSDDAYVLRGRGYFSLGDYETAAQDVVNALSINPVNIEALVLRGELQQTGMVIDVFYSNPDDAK